MLIGTVDKDSSFMLYTNNDHCIAVMCYIYVDGGAESNKL